MMLSCVTSEVRIGPMMYAPASCPPLSSGTMARLSLRSVENKMG